MSGLKIGPFEIVLLALALLAVSAVILMLAAPTKWVHRITGDRGKTIEPHSHARGDSRDS